MTVAESTFSNNSLSELHLKYFYYCGLSESCDLLRTYSFVSLVVIAFPFLLFITGCAVAQAL